jgi:hypothetical protein
VNDLLFPGPDTLCEACGYALRGLGPKGGCPECGQPIAESSPDLRTGPPWRIRPTLGNGFQALSGLLLSPKKFFRSMRVDGSNATARLFMTLIAGLTGLLWALLELGWYRPTPAGALIHGSLAAGAIVLLSYIEALGVAFFSRRRGWRVPWSLAERLVCYSSIGWVPAAALMGLVLAKLTDGSLERWMSRLIGVWDPWQSLALLVLIGAGAMMGFEMLVWTGVRQTKHANYGPTGPDPSHGIGSAGKSADTGKAQDGEHIVET